MSGGNDDSATAPGPRIGAPMTAAGIADRVRSALDSADLDEFADLLSPDVHWGAPGDANPPCQNRKQVLAWYTKGRDQGRRATVDMVEVHGNALLVGLHQDGEQQRWQVLRVGPDGVNDIRGYERREDALAKLAP
ncbi:MAG TPA: nuclear transport factor 2 family protein [Acidimicrobiales bacterium]|nr:nuclear transport factor 2 family protein [Acidimicrobiales bacterium]